MACPMCITRHHRAGQSGENVLDPDQIRGLILGPGRELGLKTLVFSGGEPLMSPLFQDTLKAAKSMGYRLYLATNLYRVEPGLLAWLVREMDSPTHTLQFSFDSMDPFQMNRIRGGNVYDQVLSNVRKLMDLRRKMGSGLRLAASLVMQPDNMDTVCATVLFLLKGLSVDQVYVQQRHSYTDVDRDNYTTQPFFRYRGDDLEQAVQTDRHTAVPYGRGRSPNHSRQRGTPGLDCFFYRSHNNSKKVRQFEASFYRPLRTPERMPAWQGYRKYFKHGNG